MEEYVESFGCVLFNARWVILQHYVIIRNMLRSIELVIMINRRIKSEFTKNNT